MGASTITQSPPCLSASVQQFVRSRIHSTLKLTAMTEIKQPLTAFERFAYGQSLHTAFIELLDWTLLPFKKFDSADEQLKAFEGFTGYPKVAQLMFNRLRFTFG